MIGIGIGIPQQQILGGYTPSSEAAAWKADIVGHSGTIADDVLQVFDNRIFTPAYSGGGNSTLSVSHALWVFINNANNIAARTTLEGNDVFASFVSSPTFDANGVKSSGTSYVDLNFNPNGIVAQDDCIIWAILNAPTFDATSRIMGCIDDGGSNRMDINEISGNAIAFMNAINGILNSNTVTSGNVLVYGKRANATQQSCGINSNLQTGTVNSISVPNLVMYLLTTNTSGAPTGNYCTKYVKACGVADSTFDAEAMLTMVNNLEADLAAL